MTTRREIGRVTVLTNPDVGSRQCAARGRAGDRTVSAARRRRRAKSSAPTPDHARRLLDDALERGTDALVVCGGDGVISLALQVVGARRHPARHHPGGHRQRPCARIPASQKRSRGGRRCRRRRLDVETVDLGRIDDHAGTTEVVRHRDGRRVRLAGQRPHQSHALAARPDALQPGDGRRAVQAAAAAVPAGVRRRRGDRRRPDAGRVRQHQELRRRHADLSRTPTTPTANSTSRWCASTSRTRLIRLFPTVFKGTHVELDEVRHRARQHGQRRLPRHQRLRRRRVRRARCRSRCPRSAGALKILATH